MTFSFGMVEKTFGLKLKSSKADQGSFVFLLEFEKDAETAKDLAHVRSAFRSGSGTAPTDLLFYFFDAENVVIGKEKIQRIEGEVTGKKGDAFRVVVLRASSKFRKIEPRQVDPMAKFEDRPSIDDKKK
jgi:hypothetical protein